MRVVLEVHKKMHVAQLQPIINTVKAYEQADQQ